LELQAAGIAPKVPIVPANIFEVDILDVAEYQAQEPVDATHIGEFQPITPEARLCGQPTASGAPCERELKTGEVNCWQHNK